MTDGLDVFVQLVMAAMTTSPWSSVTSVPSASTAGGRAGRTVGHRLGRRRRQRLGVAVGRGRFERARVRCRWVAGREGLGRRQVRTARRERHARRRRTLGERQSKRPSGVGERDAVVGAGRAGDAGYHCREVELDGFGEDRVGRVRLVEQPLLLCVGLDQRDLLGGSAGEPEVAEGLRVDREHGAGGAVLG